jgi:transposase
MNAYSLDLRLKVLKAIDRGIPRKEVVRTFGISMPTLERYLRRRREGVGLDPGRSTGRTPSICASPEERRALWRQLEENDEATLARHCELWEGEPGVKVSISTMSRAVRKLGWTFKRVVGSHRARPKEARCLAPAREASRSGSAGNTAGACRRWRAKRSAIGDPAQGDGGTHDFPHGAPSDV